MRLREAQDADLLRALLGDAAQEVSAGPESTGWTTNLSFLVDGEHIAKFVAAVEAVRQEQPHLVLTVTGPLPPYSFVE
ncbi:GvpL/GvpF family gas vesicle protein [Streptomyces sp. NPDC000880]